MTIIASFPYNLTNGTIADATQVMANFNQISTNVNSNAAASGTNSDITSLTATQTITASNSVNVGSAIAGSFLLNVVQAGSTQAYFGSTGVGTKSIIRVDAAGGTANTQVTFEDAGVARWSLIKNADEHFSLYDEFGSQTFLSAYSGGNLTLGAAQNTTISSSGVLTLGSVPSIGDNSSNAAATSMLGNWRQSSAISGTATAGSSYYGQLVEVTGSGYTITLPSSPPQGAKIGFFNSGVGTVILASTNINQMGVSASSFGLQSGQTAIYVADGYSWNWVGGSGLGVGQGWNNETGSRAFNTIYTNTTGRPIFISVTVSGSQVDTVYSIQILVSGVQVAYSGCLTHAGGGQITASADAIVPPGATYEAIGYGASGVGLYNWAELR